MGEIDYGALFEVESAGGNGQEAAEPAGSDDTETTEAAETAEEQDTETESEDASGEGEAGEKTGQGAGQSAEENSKYAAARRKAEAERDLAVQKAREETRAQMQAELDESIKALGMVNPYTKKPIVNKTDLDEYRQRYEVEKKAQFAKKAGMDDAEFQKFVDELPEVKEARAKAEQAEAAQKAVAAERAKQEIDRQIAEIREIDPSIQSLADLPKMENYQRFYELVKRGNTLTDAFRLVNLDKQQAQTREQAKQAALNQVNSKAHLDRTTTRGAGAVQVPADVVAEYRAFNPDATMEEIRAHWARYQKK
jgi:hypothetical protein